MTSHLIIWNDDPVLATWLDAGRFRLISSRPAFDALEEAELADVAGVFLLLELDWGGQAPSAFAGFEVLRRLRGELRMTGPVYCCSFLPERFVHEHAGGRAAVLLTPGHYFRQLPVTELAPDPEARPLTENLRLDILYHCFDPRGSLDEVFHNLKDHVGREPGPAVEAAFRRMAALVPPERRPELARIGATLREATEGAPPDQRPRLVATCKADVLALLPVIDGGEPHDPPVRAWRVLCIDDNPDILHTLATELGRRGISTFTAAGGEEAFAILDRDSRGELDLPESRNPLPVNTITVVICDLRFVDETSGRWRPWQGWDIIDHIYRRMTNLVSFFVLTSKKGAILRQVREPGSAGVFLFAKEDILGQPPGLNILCQRIREEGDSIFDTLCSAPGGGYWKKTWKGRIDYPLELYYRHHRMSADYRKREQWIGDRALRYIEEAQWVKAFPKKQKVDPLGFPFHFMAGQKAPPPDPGSMEKFYIKLIGRRVALGLFLRGWPEGDISDILKHQELCDNGADRQLFSAYLALSVDLRNDIPAHLLVEEREWVEQQLGEALDPADRHFYEALRQPLDELQDKLKTKGCPSDFIDDDLFIGAPGRARELLLHAIALGREYGLGNWLRRQLEALTRDNRYKEAVRRNDLSGILRAAFEED